MPARKGRRTLATAIVVVLGVLVVVAVAPFVAGLIGAPVLAVVFAPLYRRLVGRLRPSVAAAVVLVVALVGVLLPALVIAALVIGQAPAVLKGPTVELVVARLGSLNVAGVAVGPELANATGSIVAWASNQLVALAGGLARAAVNLLIALFGLYYLLISGESAWRAMVPLVPFSAETVEHLRTRFQAVTEATLVGIGVTALLQGSLVGGVFALLGLGNALMWGAVAAGVSVLPVLGVSLVWIPGVIVLATERRFAAAVALALVGLIVISNIDNIVRPLVFRRVSNIHPLIALVGAFGGVQYLGLAGLLLGPLALAFFFELLAAFDSEYLTSSSR